MTDDDAVRVERFVSAAPAVVAVAPFMAPAMRWANRKDLAAIKAILETP